jgi:hypothetical protein
MREEGYYWIKRYPHAEWEIALWMRSEWWACADAEGFDEVYFVGPHLEPPPAL